METIVEIYDALKDHFMRECKMTEDQFFLCASILKILQSIVFKEQTTK